MCKVIFLDFNGTIIDDVQLCLDLLNEMLCKQNKKTLSLDEYRHVFTFPVKKYYMDAGVDFQQESFESLAEWFIQKYQPASMECGLYPEMISTLKTLKKQGKHLVILSASERHNLLEQCDHYQITPYFDAILGIDNIHAAGKIDIAKEYLAQQRISPTDVLMVGDTLHDLEVARAIGASCILVSCGHQAVDVLKKGNVEVISSLKELIRRE